MKKSIWHVWQTLMEDLLFRKINFFEKKGQDEKNLFQISLSNKTFAICKLQHIQKLCSK